MTSCPSQSDWFKHFLLGAEDRMGFDTRKQLSVPIRVILRQLELIKLDIEAEDNRARRNLLTKVGALIAVLTAGSLRGHEGFYLDIAGTRRRLNQGRTGLVPERAMTRRIMTEDEAVCLANLRVRLVNDIIR